MRQTKCPDGNPWKAKKNNKSRDMLLVLENQILNLEVSIGGVKETFDVVEGRTMSRNYMEEAFSANQDVMKEALNASIDD
ncbi:hypothetical protein J1N35_004998 [Gossypium stocksii]|uniref:Uncharacterized protein n=1 Tax=Gossypium stocksii TaxID=47602 RepID=A0A9D3WER1_9ROSI|nr:hypothetical protein J1N35_004998 [Gossypium stocksii]